MADANKVINFIDEVDREKRKAESMNAYMNSPEYKRRQLDSCMTDAKDKCLQYIFADFYKNSIPLDSEYVSANSQQIEDEMKQFINKQTADKGLTCYVRETIKNGNHSMSKLLESVNKFVENCYADKKDNLMSLDPADLDWHFDDDKKEKLDIIAKDADLDQVADVIKQNVQAAAEYEKTQIAQKHRDIAELQKELEADDSVTDQAAVESAMLRKFGKAYLEKTVYQPSLFEGIMISKFNGITTESASDKENCYCESLRELTLININKALRFKNYDRDSVGRLAQEYARR